MADAANLTIEHNLGTTELISTLYVADDVNGTNQNQVNQAGAGIMLGHTDSESSGGWNTTSVTTSKLTLRLGANGMNIMHPATNKWLDGGRSFNGTYIKLVVTSGGGSSDGSSSVAWGRVLSGALKKSHNIKSVVYDTIQKRYQVLFEKPMKDIDYAVIANGHRGPVGGAPTDDHNVTVLCLTRAVDGMVLIGGAPSSFGQNWNLGALDFTVFGELA